MSTLKQELIERENKIGPFLIGLVGAGQMGTGLISQLEQMHGLKIVAVADVLPKRAKEAYKEAGIPDKEIHWIEDDIFKADQTLREGKRIATHSSQFLVNIPTLDAIVECTGIPNVGAIICEQSINANKPIINMNVETDATIGYYLTQKAKEKKVIYSLIAGDEPGSIKEIYDFADVLGFEIYAIGKGKNNPLDRKATPDSLAHQAEKKDMSTKMLCSFVDGTKTMVELTSIANGTGFTPEIRGGYGPKCSVEDLPKIFVPKSSGGMFSTNKVVDYAIGPAPGIFAIITTDQPKIKKDLNYLGLSGHGNYWSLYRPYHLANIEAPITIANVLLHNKETLNTPNKPVAETIAMAKKDLHSGDVIDCLGGYTVYGMVEKASVAYEQNLVPLGCTIDGVVKRRVNASEPIHYDDIELDETKRIVELRRFQDKLVNGE
jgi:predicted homoserine dehydrogenase-like protein